MFEKFIVKVFRSDGRVYGESGDECSYSSEIINGESAKALKITASLRQDLPRMKAQSGFPHDCAVQVHTG